jgi:hypothetical protein
VDSGWEEVRTEVAEGRASPLRSSATERPDPRADRGSSLPTLTRRSSCGSWALLQVIPEPGDRAALVELEMHEVVLSCSAFQPGFDRRDVDVDSPT